MSKLKLIAAIMAAGALAACGSSSSSGPSGPPGGNGNGNGGNGNSNGTGVGTQIDIQTETMPLVERFEVSGYTGEDAVSFFFSPDYKALNTTEMLDGSPYEDPHPAFYYPTCCYFETETGTDVRTGNLIEDLLERWSVTDGYLAISNARMTIGQVLSDLTDPDEVERKSDTSDSPEGASVTLGSWGELDLSQPYVIRACINDSGVAGSGNSNFEVWVDNNSGGRQVESIHSAASMLLRTETPALVGSGDNRRARRLTIEVPGDVYLTDADGSNRNTLNVIEPLDGDSMPVGTHRSFLQLRVSSGGYAVISDLRVEYQDDEPVEALDCVLNEDAFEPPPPPDTEGVPYDGVIPLSMDFSVGRDEFFGGDGAVGLFLAISDEITNPFYKVLSSGTRIHINEQDRIRFGNAQWSAGDRGGATSAGNPPNGDLDLSVPFSITLEITDLPAADGQLQVFVDNSTNGAANSLHGDASRVLQLTPTQGLEVGTLVINVPGDVTMNGTVLDGYAVPEHVGTANSLLSFRCPSNCGNADSGDAGGIEIASIEIAYTEGDPDGNGDVDPAGTDEEWDEFPANVYAAILDGDITTSNIPVTVSDEAHEVNGLLFWRDSSGESLRHRGGSNAEWNYNGTSFSGGNSIEVPAVGEEAPEVRNYIGVPVEAGRAVTVTAEHRNSGSPDSGKIVFIGSDGTVLGESDAFTNEPTISSVELADGHGQTHVKVIYSREGAGGGGMHLSQLHRTYND